MQSTSAAEEAGRRLWVDPTIRLVVVHNLTRFLETSKRILTWLESLKGVISRLKGFVAMHDVVLVITGD